MIRSKVRTIFLKTSGWEILKPFVPKKTPSEKGKNKTKEFSNVARLISPFKVKIIMTIGINAVTAITLFALCM
tara:strand:+ start:370 stop:588 length:219 start_codon:yes stop_codon:yes gene_type:complete